jgi:MFS family permease
MVARKRSPVRKVETVSGDRRSSFNALRHRDFRLMWMGQVVSVTGSQMQLVAINWHVYLLTKSALALGAVGLVRVVPIILCSLAGGVVADAVDRKRLILATQVVMLLSAGALSLIFAGGFLRSVWPIYLLTAVSSAAVAFEAPARQALLPALVPEEDFQNAVSLYMIVFHVSMIAGPALAGLLLNSYDPYLIYAINAASFLAVIVAVSLIRASGRAGRADNPEASGISLGALSEGLRFVWRTPIIVQTMTLDFIATFFASATALLPIFATEILRVGARGLGMLAAAPAVGSVLTALVMARLGTLRRQGAIVIGSIAVYGAATIAFGLSRVFWFSLLMLAVTGAADTVSTVLRQTIRQLSTPNYLRGRMTSVNMIFFMGGPQLGELEAGAVASLTGSAAISVLTGGIGCLVAVALTAWMAQSLLSYEGEVTRARGPK